MRKHFSYYAYKFKHWFFKWDLDDEKDLTLTVAGFIHLIKYKEHTVIHFGDNHLFSPAPENIEI